MMMQRYGFSQQGASVCLDGVPLMNLAQRFATPLYVYSGSVLKARVQALQQAMSGLPVQMCYAVKANANLYLLQQLADWGLGFDIVSAGELARVQRVAAQAPVVFSGVGKRDEEIHAALDAGILAFNVESAHELQRINTLAAARDEVAPVLLRVNPEVSVATHPYIATGMRDNKFGIQPDQALALAAQWQRFPHLRLLGIGCHIGSQLLDLSGYDAAWARLRRMADFIAKQGHDITHLDLGGGIGIAYQQEDETIAAADYAALIDRHFAGNWQLLIEPGRSLVGPCGVFLTRVQQIKDNGHKRFAIVDGAMNDFPRPSLYQAWHQLEAVDADSRALPAQCVDVVGPVCESGDFLARDRLLSVQEGSLLAALDAGAYCFSMASQYNSRPRPAEVWVEAGQEKLIRKRETLSSLWAGEML